MGIPAECGVLGLLLPRGLSEEVDGPMLDMAAELAMPRGKPGLVGVAAAMVPGFGGVRMASAQLRWESMLRSGGRRTAVAATASAAAAVAVAVAVAVTAKAETSVSGCLWGIFSRERGI